MSPLDKTLSVAERFFLVSGVILLAIFVLAMVHRAYYSRQALKNFDEARATIASRKSDTHLKPYVDEPIDFSLWSDKRIREYRKSLEILKDTPLAVLEIDRLNIRAPVFQGTDELVLNRGLGWIVGTSRPGEMGNIGISGHRDGFFRGLKDIATGDVIELSTLTGTSTYIADQLEIVNPEDVQVLLPRQKPSLTLTTCYPFYFAGDAPKRFIVHANLKQQMATEQSTNGSAYVRATKIYKEKQ
jgi:sortase A